MDERSGFKAEYDVLETELAHELLDVEKNFVPASMDVGDELYPNGFFVFNITKIIKFINDNKDKIKLVSIDVKAYRSNFSNLNESHIDLADITSPVILAEISPGRYNVTDGHHRIEKAYRLGLENIPAYMLTVKQHIPFLTSLEAYYAYIEYWNLKVKDGQRLKKEKRRR